MDGPSGPLDRRFELAATVLLALAAVATAWAATSRPLDGEQAKAQSASIAARVESTRAANVANRQAQIDVALFTQWVDAYARDETELADFYRKRFRTEFRPAFEAWIATRPRTNPNAPLSPFAMPQYKLAATATGRPPRGAGGGGLPARGDASSSGPTTTRWPSCCSPRRCSSRASAPGSLAHATHGRSLGLGYVLFLGSVIWIATFPVSLSV